MAADTTEQTPYMDIQAIRRRIPHRYPFLLIDRVESFSHGASRQKKLGRKIVATKNVSVNEPFFNGHFPENPVMPGVLQIEAMAQAGALACVPEDGESLDVLIAKINNARFRRPVVPGDVLRIEAEITGEKGDILSLHCKATCDGQEVAEVDLMAKVMMDGSVKQ